jgi:hypothetical protein
VEAREFRFASRLRASFTRVGQHHHPAAFHSLRKLVAVSCGHVSNANSISSAFNSQRWPNSSTSRGPKFLEQHSYRIQYQRRKTQDRSHLMRGDWDDSVLAWKGLKGYLMSRAATGFMAYSIGGVVEAKDVELPLSPSMAAQPEVFSEVNPNNAC